MIRSTMTNSVTNSNTTTGSNTARIHLQFADRRQPRHQTIESAVKQARHHAGTPKSQQCQCR